MINGDKITKNNVVQQKKSKTKNVVQQKNNKQQKQQSKQNSEEQEPLIELDELTDKQRLFAFIILNTLMPQRHIRRLMVVLIRLQWLKGTVI
ncbi:hypothetical protein [Niallia circulans]|uniref:hypothetical protein n=1 Tax=Niallia circulans TaxID=1397 RepID=UPI001F28D39E|nr:hypothetical protein [Niallia circulans]